MEAAVALPQPLGSKSSPILTQWGDATARRNCSAPLLSVYACPFIRPLQAYLSVPHRLQSTDICHMDCDRVRVRCAGAIITLKTRLVPLAIIATGGDPTLHCEYLLRPTAASTHLGTLAFSRFSSWVYLGTLFEPKVLVLTSCAYLRTSVGVCPNTMLQCVHVVCCGTGFRVHR